MVPDDGPKEEDESVLVKPVAIVAVDARRTEAVLFWCAAIIPPGHRDPTVTTVPRRVSGHVGQESCHVQMAHEPERVVAKLSRMVGTPDLDRDLQHLVKHPSGRMVNVRVHRL
jgi:hypothetical protein